MRAQLHFAERALAQRLPKYVVPDCITLLTFWFLITASRFVQIDSGLRIIRRHS